MNEIRGQAPVQHQKDMIIDKCEEIKFVETLTDEQLGQIQLHRLHPYVKYVGSKTIPTQFIPNFQKRIALRHSNLFFYIKKAHAAQRIPSQSGTFNVFFEYNYSSIEEMLNRRKEQGWHYPEIELWTIVKEVCAGLKFLMDNNIHHGEIKKQTIFFDDEYLLYRVYDNYLVNADKFYKYQMNNQSLLNGSGTPPPEFSSYEFIQFKNTYKVDMWNFGLVVLECATLSNVTESIYSNGTLKIDALNGLLQSLNGKYSTQFINTLLRMLEPDPRNRFDWQLLQKFLSSEPLAKQLPTYQVESTQLHPSRSLMNLHEIVVGAQPQTSQTTSGTSAAAANQQKNIVGNENLSPNLESLGQLSLGSGPSQSKDSNQSYKLNDQYNLEYKTKNQQLNQLSGGKFSTNTSNMDAFDGSSIQDHKLISSLEEKEKSTSSTTSQNQAVNQRLIQLNKKIQETLIQSQKKTKKLTQNEKK